MQVGITINIIEYFPLDFDFTGFNFIFIYESKQIDKEISYLRKNSIYHKIYIPFRKDIKFSVRMTKEDSLIGLCEFIIPYSVLFKKENNYSKICQITMTESLKKLIFGSSFTNNTIKINIHSAIQYLGLTKDKSLRKIKSNMNKDIFENRMINRDKEREPKSNRINNFTSDLRNNSISNQRELINNSNRNKLPKSQRIYQNPFPPNQISPPKNKSQYNIHNTETKENKKEKIMMNMKIDLNMEQEFNDININDEDPTDLSRIDKDFEIEDINSDKEKKLYEFINNLIKENPLAELENKKDVGEMLIYTRDIISQLLDYQIKFYETLKNSVDLNHKFNELLIKYNEKYRYIVKKMNKLTEQMNTHDMKSDMVMNNNINEKNNINEMITLKNKEIDILKEIYKNQIDEEEINNNLTKKNNDIQLKILLNVLYKISSKYGPINSLLATNNSTENELQNLNQILNKYKEDLTINSSKQSYNNTNINTNTNNINEDTNFCETKKNDLIGNEDMEYVLSSNMDDLDKLLNNLLKNIYNNNTKNISKVIFKRIGKNSYQYGKQKLIVKREDNNIKVRVGGIFFSLDKFIESNSSNEYVKKNLKVKSQSKRLTNKSK